MATDSRADTLRAIAQPFVISNPDDAYGRCPDQARALCGALQTEFPDAICAYGHYRLSESKRAPTSWAQYHREAQYAPFPHHWWVKVGGFILDPTAAQFGEAEVCYRGDDNRYHEQWNERDDPGE